MQQGSRIDRIGRQLSKLNNLIELTKNESQIAHQLLQKCHQESSSSDSESPQWSPIEAENKSTGCSGHNRQSVSQLFSEANSRETVHIATNNQITEEFYGEGRFHENREPAIFLSNGGSNQHLDDMDQSIELMNRSIQDHKRLKAGCDRQIGALEMEEQSLERSQFEFEFETHNSRLSSSGFKESNIEISEIKPVDTTIKKAKLQKSNMHSKNKKNLFEKQRIISNSTKNNEEKIGRIKSENKLLSNASNFKRGLNSVKEQMSLKKDMNKSKGPISGHTGHGQNQQHKNYLSNKIETLNSKRNLKYNSISKQEKQEKSSVNTVNRNKFHLNLQKEVTMKITDLKIKKNLCQIETSYLSASVKITKEQLSKIEDSGRQYSEETLLKHFILQSIINFISQYNDETWTHNEEEIKVDSQLVARTIKSPQKFIKIINKLPDILRRRNIVSEFICKDFINNKAYIDQKVQKLQNSKQFTKEPLFLYLGQLHSYIEFLLNNNMIHETKRNKIFNPTSEQFFSDRSAKEMKLTTGSTKDKTKFRESSKKEYSERKKHTVTGLKRVNTSKALKKGVSTKGKKA